jgi:signal transduction histidine kinase
MRILMTANRKTACSQVILHSASPEIIEALQRIMRNASTLLQIPDLLLSLLDTKATPLATFPAGTDLSHPPLLPLATGTDLSHLTSAGNDLSCPREGIIINDVGRDLRFCQPGNAATGSLLCVSLIEQEQPIGTLIAYSPRVNVFSQQHLRMLAFVAEQAVMVIGMSQQAEKEAIQARTKILSTVTHELRSPINTINGYLDLALSGVAGELNAELREFLQRARSGSENLFALLEDALLISRADAGQLRLSREPVSLQDVIIDAVEEMELTARDYEIAVTVEIAEELPLLHADAARLQQVVRDLLSNALHFTPSGGQVAVMASTNCSAMDAPQDPHFVKLQVIDTGCGIAPAFHQRIFERFFQIPESQQQGRKGQGLGLTAVKMIVELHGGTISVASEPGRGSSFLCVLPIS